MEKLGAGMSPFKFAGFHDTLGSPDTRIRGSYKYNVPPADMRKTAPAYKGSAADNYGETMRGAAMTSTRRTGLHQTTQEDPLLRETLRRQSHVEIHGYEKQVKAQVLLMYQAQRAADLENEHLIRSQASLEKFLEKPRRTIWVVERNLQTRALRPIQIKDSVEEALLQELSLAKKCKTEVEGALTSTITLLQSMKSARAAMAKEIAIGKQGLSINSEVFSGVVTTFPIMQGDSPACFHTMATLHSQSQERRGANKSLCDLVAQRMSAQKAQVQAELTASKQAHLHSERDLALVRGESTIAINSTARNINKLIITRERNEGPVNGVYHKTADRFQRPRIRAYNKGETHHLGTTNRLQNITEKEESSAAYNALSRSIHVASRDMQQLESHQHNLSGAMRDQHRNAGVDKLVMQERERYHYSRRV